MKCSTDATVMYSVVKSGTTCQLFLEGKGCKVVGCINQTRAIKTLATFGAVNHLKYYLDAKTCLLNLAKRQILTGADRGESYGKQVIR